MADYASNTPISRPVKIHGVEPTVDFGGIGFNPTMGWVFDVQDDMEQFEMPAPRADGT